MEKLQEFSFEDRQAYFSCILCFYLSPEEVFFFEGRLTGYITYESKGANGFGYDPVFIPYDHGELLKEEEFEKSLTLAENPSWKKENSHRAKACRAALEFFKERICQNVGN